MENRQEIGSQALLCLLLNRPPTLSSSVEILLILRVRVTQGFNKAVCFCTSASVGSTTLHLTAVFVCCKLGFYFFYLDPRHLSPLQQKLSSATNHSRDNIHVLCVTQSMLSDQQLTAAPASSKSILYKEKQSVFPVTRTFCAVIVSALFLTFTVTLLF